MARAALLAIQVSSNSRVSPLAISLSLSKRKSKLVPLLAMPTLPSTSFSSEVAEEHILSVCSYIVFRGRTELGLAVDPKVG